MKAIGKLLRYSFIFGIVIPYTTLANEPALIAGTLQSEPARELTHEELYFLKKEQREIEEAKPKPIKSQAEIDYEHAGKRAQVGKGLLIAGGIIFSTSLIVIIPGMKELNSPNEPDHSGGMALVMVGMYPAFLGATGIIAGSSMLIRSKQKQKQLLSEFSFTPVVNPLGKEFGAQLSISF